MKIPLSTFIILLLMSVIACSSNTGTATLDKTEIRNEVSQAFDSYITHVNTKGLEEVEQYFSSDDQFYWVEDGIVQYPNWDSLAASVQQFGPTIDSVRMQVAETRVDVIDRNHAMLYAQFKEDLTTKAGYTFTLDGALTILMQNEENGWKFLYGHSSVKKPGGDQ